MSIAPGRDSEWNEPLQPLPLRRRLRLVSPPLPLTSLLGRDDAVTTGTALLAGDAVRLVTLVGPGGIGKTRLALGIAAACAAAFEDQVAWAPVATATSPEAVAAALAQAVGVGETGSTLAIDALKSALRDARLLLVVDNFEQALDAAPVLSDLLQSCPELAILVTSRALLRIAGERPFEVPPLTSDPDPGRSAGVSPAVQLFAQRAAGVTPAFALTPDAIPIVAEICRRLDELPLAIELAAARVNHLPLTDLRDRLDRRLAFLTAGVRGVPDRHRTMRDAIAWSYDLLTPDQQALFRSLAVFVGGFTLEAAAAVFGGQESGVRGQKALSSLTPDSRFLTPLAALIDNSLVRLESPIAADARYTMLETIREFAAECLVDRGEVAAVRDAHAAYFVALAERAKPELETPSAVAWGARLEAEHGNILAALAWLEAAGHRHDLLRLAYAMVNFWGTSLRLREARSWLERALDPAWSATLPPALCAGAARGLGWIADCLGDFDTAEARLEEALATRRQIGNVLDVANTLTLLGQVANHRGDEERAQACFAEALDGFRAVGQLQGIAWCLVAQANAADRRGDFDEAARLAGEAVAAARESGNQNQLTDTLVALGQAASARADWDAAAAALREALGLGRSLVNRMTYASALAGMAAVAVAAGEAERAARLLGAVAVLNEAGGLVRAAHPDLHDMALSAARNALDEPSFAAAWEAGRELTQLQVEAEALAITIQPAAPAPHSLTPRELDVLRMLAAGRSDRAIADALFIGERTVNTHVARVFAKLGVRNRAAAVAAGLAAGLIEPDTATTGPA